MKRLVSGISKFDRRILSLMAAGFSLLLFNVIASNWLSSQSQDFASSTALEHRLKNAVLDLRSGLQDAETGQRGYLLTVEPAYLAPFDNAIRSLPGLLEVLQSLGYDDPFIQGKTVEIVELSRSRIDLARKTIDLVSNGQREAAIELVRSGDGKRLMDQLRSLIQELTQHQDKEIARRAESLTANSRWSDFANISSMLLIIALGIGSAILVSNNMKELEDARATLYGLNQNLEKTVVERTGEVHRANEEIQQFAYIVSHDLRAPLVNIMGFTSELDNIGETVKQTLDRIESETPEHVPEACRTAVDADLPEALSFIRASTSKMDRLINSILKLSREGRRTVTPERINMTDLARGIAASLKHQSDERKAALVVEELPDLTTDRIAMEQVLGNLIENAIKYLEEGRQGTITVTGRHAGAFNEYSVADNGRGIAAADKERVFELFRRDPHPIWYSVISGVRSGYGPVGTGLQTRSA